MLLILLGSLVGGVGLQPSQGAPTTPEALQGARIWLQGFCDQIHFLTRALEIHLLCSALSLRKIQAHPGLAQKLNKKSYLKRFQPGLQ